MVLGAGVAPKEIRSFLGDLALTATAALQTFTEAFKILFLFLSTLGIPVLK